MTLTELKYIVAVAQEKHFGRAAQRCFVSQPTLSMGVKKLEDELGVTLFERGKKEVSMTSIGLEIINQAQQVLEQSSLIKDIAQSGKDPLSGTLRLGVIYTIGPYLLPHLIPELKESCPRLHLSIDEDYTANLAEKLKRGELDLIMVSLPFKMSGVITWEVYEEPFRVLVPSSHPLNTHDTLTEQELANEGLLLLGPGNCFRDQILQALPSFNNTSDDGNNMDGTSLETIRHMVASGLGVTIVPCTAAGVDHYSQRLLHIARFEEPAPSRQVALAWRQSFHRQAVIEEVYKAIQRSPLSCVHMLNAAPSSMP